MQCKAAGSRQPSNASAGPRSAAALRGRARVRPAANPCILALLGARAAPCHRWRWRSEVLRTNPCPQDPGAPWLQAQNREDARKMNLNPAPPCAKDHSMLYFAYGSNLDAAQMRARCRNDALTPQGVALLPDHRLGFTHRSPIRHGGVADVVPAADAEVWGCLYDLAESEFRLLDGFEGVPHVYRRHAVTVWREGDARRAVDVTTYVIVNRITPEPPPHPDYLAQIVRGATAVGLPEAYLARLRAVVPASVG
jgi:gamma-glutamylcyclotransferase (GGCT)/AIG2-like uncharacterized protein YtfP